MDDWQLQCCGTPFRRGDRVEWRVHPADSEWLGAVLGSRLPPPPVYAEEHHGGWRGDAEPLTVAGTVLTLDAVSCRFAPREPGGAVYPVAGSGVLEPLPAADGWHRVTRPLRFVGYLVTLDTEFAVG